MRESQIMSRFGFENISTVLPSLFAAMCGQQLRILRKRLCWVALADGRDSAKTFKLCKDLVPDSLLLLSAKLGREKPLPVERIRVEPKCAGRVAVSSQV